MVVQGVVATNFIASSRALKEALNSANLLKSLPVNVVIQGERGTGKTVLATYISNKATIIDADEILGSIEMLENGSEIILKNIDKISNTHLLNQFIEQKELRIIATSTTKELHAKLKEIFAVDIYIPPFVERIEDVQEIVERLKKEASLFFAKDFSALAIDIKSIDVSENIYSIRRSVYLQCLLGDSSDIDIAYMMERYLEPKIGSGDDYRKFLYLYEVPLLKMGQRRFKSQLKMSQMFGLNRNTLRKKLEDNGEYL